MLQTLSMNRKGALGATSVQEFLIPSPTKWWGGSLLKAINFKKFLKTLNFLGLHRISLNFLRIISNIPWLIRFQFFVELFSYFFLVLELFRCPGAHNETDCLGGRQSLGAPLGLDASLGLP